MDYFSDNFELDELPDTTSETVSGCLKQHFARHGIPDIIVSDNGLIALSFIHLLVTGNSNILRHCRIRASQTITKKLAKKSYQK